MKKSIIAVLSTIGGAAAGAVAIDRIQNKSIRQKEGKIDKFKSYYNMLNQWLMLKQSQKSLEQYFIDNNYKSIAIYGMGEMGNRLYDELKNTSITVKYGIDKEAISVYSDLEVYEVDDELAPVDVIVVTAIFAFDEVSKILSENCNFPVVSLDDVVFDLC